METKERDLIILGGGPGGYTAAFYAADRGLSVTLVESESRLGGVCMNHGCIPSKALLQTTAFLEEAATLGKRGIKFKEPSVDTATLNHWKSGIIEKLGGGLKTLAEKRGVELICGRGVFEDRNLLRVETDEGQEYYQFEKTIIATGSSPAMPDVFDIGNPRVLTSREALDIRSVSEKFLVIGGGYIGLELGTIYARLGSSVTVIEALDSLMPGTDKDLIEPVTKKAKRLFSAVHLGTEVKELKTAGEQVNVTFSKEEQEESSNFDAVLVAVGRGPNTSDIGLSDLGVELDDDGYITTDEQKRSSNPNVFAIGDVAGEPMLAHKATKDARVAVEAILGDRSSAKDFIIPAVVYTDPELAWCGLTEKEAKEQNLDFKVSVFPWKSSGRALTHDRTDGLTKLIIDDNSQRILGVGICGHGAADLIAEGVVAMEMGASVRELAEIIHPHPTLSETLKEAAEHFFDAATHLKS